ncbi:MAG: ribonuclease R, partial [Pseudomonadota bacterium]
MTGLPDRDQLIAWINDNPGHAAKREIARAFGVKGADRVELKRLIRSLEDEGVIQRRGKRLSPAGHLPPVGLFAVTGPAPDGELYLTPKDWPDDRDPPRIVYLPRKADPALRAGDTALAKIRPVHEEDGVAYEARLIRRLTQGAPRRVGIFRSDGEGGGRIVPVDKKDDREWAVPAGAIAGARDGDLVEAERVSRERFGLPRAKIVEIHGDPHAPKSLSLIAMVEHGIPLEFPAPVLAEAQSAPVLAEAQSAPDAPGPGPEREDLR